MWVNLACLPQAIRAPYFPPRLSFFRCPVYLSFLYCLFFKIFHSMMDDGATNPEKDSDLRRSIIELYVLRHTEVATHEKGWDRKETNQNARSCVRKLKCNSRIQKKNRQYGLLNGWY